MVVNAKNMVKVELEVDVDLAETILDGLATNEMASIFNDEKILSTDFDTCWGWNDKMINDLNENGRKHIKKLYDMVCKWYEANPEDAEAEGYIDER